MRQSKKLWDVSIGYRCGEKTYTVNAGNPGLAVKRAFDTARSESFLYGRRIQFTVTPIGG
jgi:hypothetical protein